MNRNHVAIVISLVVGAASGAFLTSAVAESGQPLVPAASTIVPVGVSSAGGNFAWFLNGRTVWSCTAGAGSASPPVCTKGTLP